MHLIRVMENTDRLIRRDINVIPAGCATYAQNLLELNLGLKTSIGPVEGCYTGALE